MKIIIDTTEKTIQVEEAVDLDELMREFGGKGFRIVPKFTQTYPVYPIYPDYPTITWLDVDSGATGTSVDITNSQSTLISN